MKAGKQGHDREDRRQESDEGERIEGLTGKGNRHDTEKRRDERRA